MELTEYLDHCPPVSIVMPTLNERSVIRDCLDSLLSQDYPSITEILVIDGGSTDGTRELAQSLDPRVLVIDNPGVTAAAAMNVGLAAAANDLIVRVDSHTIYLPDYVSRSVDSLHESGADWVGGPMRPVGLTSFGRAVAAVTTSRLGIGNGRFHYATEAVDAETVYLGTFDRRIVFDVGGYDDGDLQWAAEDQELAFRLRRVGRRIRIDPRIRSWYFPRQTPRALWRQYFNYGMCKASTLRKHRTLPYWRPLVPVALVTGCIGGAALTLATRQIRWSAIPLGGYATIVGAGSLAVGADPGVAPHRAATAFGICHWAYGLGFLNGMVRIATGRPFDNRPRRGR